MQTATEEIIQNPPSRAYKSHTKEEKPSSKIGLSFEFFPPKTTNDLDQLIQTASQLEKFKPDFFSVTYGALGSTQELTLQTLIKLRTVHARNAAHISCIGSTREKIGQLLEEYAQQGIKDLVALRGDCPSGQGSVFGDFTHASDLVRFIRETTGDYFQIFVAAYPEGHPQALSIKTDLEYFKQKVECGANAAITQYFFHADSYCQLKEDCQKLNINIPLIPGLMPIYNFNQLCRFSDMCGAEIPRYLRKRFELFKDDPDSTRALGIEILTRLCETLIRDGASNLHFYTLNRASVVSQILGHLGL